MHSFFLFPSVFTNSGSTGTTERQQSVNTTAQTWRGVGVILWCSQTHLKGHMVTMAVLTVVSVNEEQNEHHMKAAQTVWIKS